MDFKVDFKNIDWKGHVEKTVSFVAKKAGEAKEITKIKYQIFDLKGDVKKLYSQIGKLVYEEMGLSPALPDDVLMKCDILEAKLAKIAALQEKAGQISEKKVEIVCPVCGNVCTVDEDVCPACGASLIENVDAEVEQFEEEE